MSDRYDLPKIKPDSAPTIFNHEAGKWGWISGFVASIAVLPMVFVNKIKDVFRGDLEIVESSKLNKAAVIVLSAEVVGAIAGGLAEKNKQEREQVEGKVVKTPGYWNKGILSGLLISGVVRGGYALISENSSAPTMPGWLGRTITWGGAIVGSIVRKNQLQHDFDRALDANAVRQEKINTLLQTALAQQNTVTYKNTATPEEVAALESLQAPAKGHAAKHLQPEPERAETEAQAPVKHSHAEKHAPSEPHHSHVAKHAADHTEHKSHAEKAEAASHTHAAAMTA